MKIKIDLVDVIRQAAPQVWGSDERQMLYAWLERNTAEQIVEIESLSPLPPLPLLSPLPPLPPDGTSGDS